MALSKWVLETRPQFLLLSVVLVLHGAMLSYWQGAFDPLDTVLAVVALVLLHGSVNVLNDWDDYRSGIDLETRRTPFSGGSGLLPEGRMTPGGALGLGIGLLVAGSAIGVYLAIGAGWELLAMGLVGVVSIVAYTPVLNRLYLGELSAGLGLGYLPVLGAYFIQCGELSTAAWISAVPAGLLTYNLLLLNEFPDMEADMAGGRRHMVTLLGRRRAWYLYAAVELATFVVIVVGVLMGVLTPWALLGLGGLAFGLRAIAGARAHHEDVEALVPALGANVASVLSTNALLALAYVIAGSVS